MQQRTRYTLLTAIVMFCMSAAAYANCIIPRDATWTQFPGNDDGSTAAISLPFNFNLYGATYNQVYINNNGNLTFTGPTGVFSASGFPFGTAMVAPFWADVDTRPSCSGGVYYKVFSTRIVVLWENVAYYNQNCTYRNTFEVVIGTTNDPVIGLGQNVLFNYGDMQWTTGDASSGSGGFGGIPATVGINKGDNVNYVQVGRFNQNNSNYDGGGGNNDGINYLDDQCFAFNVSNAGNIPPSFSGLPANNTINLGCGQSASLTIQAIGPEVNQTVSSSVNANGTCGVTSSITNGSVSTINLSVTAMSCNAGTNTITITATDNGTPAQTTTVNITVNVSAAPTPTVTASGPTTFCQGGNVVLTSSSAATYQWQLNGVDITGATLQSYTATAGGSYTVVTTNTTGCSATSAATTVTVNPNPSVSIADVNTFCSNNTIYNGYGQTSLTLTATGSGGSSAYSYDWAVTGSSTSLGSGNTLTVSPSATTSYTVTLTDANTCTATASIAVRVLDVRCGNNLDKVMVCHNTGSSTNPINAICISPSAVPTHLTQHGDCLGDCSIAFARRIGGGSYINLEEGNIVVFPNPAHNRINVELKETGSAYRSYQVTDINGRVVEAALFSGDIHADVISIDISSHAPGLYIIRAITDEGTSLTKFVVE